MVIVVPFLDFLVVSYVYGGKVIDERLKQKKIKICRKRSRGRNNIVPKEVVSTIEEMCIVSPSMNYSVTP